MHAFEKEVAEKEMIYPLCSYPYQVVAITDQAKLFFGLERKKRGPIEKIKEIFKRAEELNEFPFVGKATFYVEGNEENQILRVKRIAQFNMARHNVRGISYEDKHWSFKSALHVNLVEGEDYKIKIGKKITHEEPKRITFNDIKELN